MVGRVVKPHGTTGEVLVEVLSDAPDRFAPGSRLEAGDPEGDLRRLTVRRSRVDRGKLLVTFNGVRNRDEAGAIRGFLSIPATDAAPPAEGTYYEWQLVGFAVVDEDGAALGTLVRVDERAGNDLWVVDTGRGETQVPAVEEFIRSVDTGAKQIVVRVIPGLFE